MMLFAERFSDMKILPPLAAKLSWSHIIEHVWKEKITCFVL
jgi:hypothetical protein